MGGAYLPLEEVDTTSRQLGFGEDIFAIFRSCDQKLRTQLPIAFIVLRDVRGAGPFCGMVFFVTVAVGKGCITGSGFLLDLYK